MRKPKPKIGAYLLDLHVKLTEADNEKLLELVDAYTEETGELPSTSGALRWLIRRAHRERDRGSRQK